jgi:hypothetical protein
VSQEILSGAAFIRPSGRIEHLLGGRRETAEGARPYLLPDGCERDGILPHGIAQVRLIGSLGRMRLIKVGTLWITYQCAKEYGIKDGPQCRDFPYRCFKVFAHEAQIETI